MISAAPFRDRVAHHGTRVLETVFETLAYNFR
jgi:hypothetical protein